MKSSLRLLGLALLLAVGCAKKDSPTPAIVTVASKVSATNAGAPINVTMAVEDYSDGKDNSNVPYSRAVIVVYFPDPSGFTGGIKYYLKSTDPLGAVTRVVARPTNSNDFVSSATGTLTGRTETVAGTKHLYLSGTFRADMGPGRTDVAGTFTDLKAY